MAETLSHRERVRLALQHQTTDRIPIAMVCAGINAPAHRALEDYLARERQTNVAAYLQPLIDVRGCAPPYVGPARPAGTDMWGVHRSPVSYGADSYHEIDHYPLGAARS
ncbi:MAG: hypothetical protein KKI08_06665, partial [Armatimonadetes bacterium]|nr:hypothetical protein [Armatimonadota bacterium]